MAIEIFTERNLLKDILPEKAKDIAKQYKLKENEIEFIRKKNPLKAEDIKIEDGERAAIRYINTADLDRDNEIVLPSGGQVNDFKKSPSVLYGHNYQGLPIGKDIWIKHVQGKGWLAKTVYAKHQLAVDVYNLVKEKFINTSSIGFIPLEWVKPDDKSWSKWKEIVKSEYSIKEKLIDNAKRIYTKWLLLEHSDVPIASNINALNIAVGKGFEIKSQELIDDLELVIIDDEKEKNVDEIIDEIEDEVELSDESLERLKEGIKDVKEGRVTEVDLGDDEAETEEKDTVNKPEETTDYIRIPVKGEEGKHSGHRIRTITISANEGIKALYCGECKKVITYLFDKAKNWTMAKAKKWMADHGKNIIIGAGTTDDSYAVMETEEKEEIKPIENDGIKKPQEEEPSKGFGLNEIYEIIKENKELINTLEDMTVELKAGAVLNRKNKTDLTNAQQLIQNVLDSAETTEEGKEVDGLEIEGDKELDIKEKEYQEEKDVVDINGAKDIIKSYIDKQEEENIKYKKEQYAYFVKMAEEIPDMLIKRKIGKVI